MDSPKGIVRMKQTNKQLKKNVQMTQPKGAVPPPVIIMTKRTAIHTKTDPFGKKAACFVTKTTTGNSLIWKWLLL